MKNALNNQVGMLGDMFLWLVANLKQGVIYFIKQGCGNDIMASVYVRTILLMSVMCSKYIVFAAMLQLSLLMTFATLELRNLHS